MCAGEALPTSPQYPARRPPLERWPRGCPPAPRTSPHWPAATLPAAAAPQRLTEGCSGPALHGDGNNQ